MSKNLTNSLRGIAVILVILSHFIGGGFALRYFTPLGGIGVAMFLFLSGFGLEESYTHNGLKRFWPKRLCRILIPYLLWAIMWFIVSHLFKYQTSLLPRYWYLEYLVLWYALFWLSKYLPKRYGYWFLITVAVALFFVMHNTQTEQTFSFILGMMVSDRKEQLSEIGKVKWVFICILLFGLGVSCLALKQIPIIRSLGEESLVVKMVQLGIKLPLGLAITIATILLFREVFIFKALTSVGVVSLELYLVQMQFYTHIQGDWKSLVLFIVVVVFLSIILHKVSKWMLDKLFTLEWLRR